MLGPAGILNVDHKAVRDAVLLARPDAVLYADLPYALHPDHGGFALPEEIADRDAERIEVRLTEAELTEKLAAVRRYPTQLDQLVAAFGDFLGPAGLGREAAVGTRRRPGAGVARSRPEPPGAGSRTSCRGRAADSTKMWPPLCLTMPYVVARPSPVPWPTGFVVKNGSKIRACVASSMPVPVSLTVIRQ